MYKGDTQILKFETYEYNGETAVKDGLTVQHGKGKQEWKDGSYYEGSWFEGE